MEKLLWALEHPSRFCRYLLDFVPFDYQEELIEAFLKRDYVALRWSRQTGKSYIVSALLLWYGLTHPGSYTVVVGPSWRQTKLIINRINSFLRKLPRQWYAKPRKTIVEFTNGSRIEAFPNNPETIRGPTVDIVYCDEFNFIPNDVEMFDAIVWTLATKKHGKFMCSSTPWTTDSVFYRIFHDEAFRDYYKSHVRWEDAVEPKGPLSQSKIDQLRKQYEGDIWRWDREMEAEWSEDISHWLPQDLLARSLLSSLELVSFSGLQSLAVPTKRFSIGVDFGKLQDFSVITVIEMNQEGEQQLIHYHRFRLGTPYASVIGYVKKVCDVLQSVLAVNCDKTGVGDYIVEDMQRGGIPNVEGINFTAPNKEALATLLKQRLIDGVLRIPYSRDLLAELNLVRFQLSKSGGILFSHPDGSHDDLFWSTALAVWGLRLYRGTRQPQVSVEVTRR